MDSSNSKLNRRKLLQKGALSGGGKCGPEHHGSFLLSRIAGANERISLGHIGIGNRGGELDGIVALLKDTKNVEVTAVCDLWTYNLEHAR